MIYAAWSIATQARRFARRRVLPVIVESLRPLAPTAEELEAPLGQLKQMNSPIGRALRVDDLRKAFGRDADGSPAAGLAA